MLKRKRDHEADQIKDLVRHQDVSGLERFLLSKDIKGVNSRIAIEGLMRFDSAEAWDAIGHVLTQSTTAVIEGIIQQLEENGNTGAIRALGECLSNRNVFIRSAAVRALSKHNTSATMPHLLRASRDPEASLSRMAARVILRRIDEDPLMLGRIAEYTLEGILDLMDDRWAMELLSDSYPENIRRLAALRLGRIGGDEASQALVSIIQSGRSEQLSAACWQALDTCSTVSDFILLPLLVDPRPDIKSKAIGVYARFSGITASDLITGMTKDGNPEVRSAALSGLVVAAGGGAIPVLEAALEDAEDSIRLHAVKLLCNQEDASPELVAAVRSQSGEVRRLALVSLANRGIMTSELVQAYVEFLYKGSSCTDLSQREYLDSLAVTAKNLGKSQSFEALLALTALARSVIRRLRRSAIEGLMMFPAEDRADALYSLLDAHDTDIVKNVAMGLHECRDERAVIPLVRTALECRGKALQRAKEALKVYPKTSETDFLISCLVEKWPSVRRYGAEQLKILKDPASIPALLEASQDEDVEVQLAVFEAMGPFASDHENVTKRMLEAIGYGDISVRQAACEALGEARCKAAVPDLIKALHNFFLRPRATEALRRIGDRKGYLAMKRLEIREKLFKRPKKKAGARH